MDVRLGVLFDLHHWVWVRARQEGLLRDQRSSHPGVRLRRLTN